ncbi:MAG: hypothetical protein Q4D81_04420 [Eubacteriales bacterium]|nr:hypothetical protein [Eubacteriales bacterium]
MKKLTAVFLDVLGRETGLESRAAALARVNMQTEFQAKTRELLSGGTLYFSGEGHRLRQDLLMLRERVAQIDAAGKAAQTGTKLQELFVRAEKLHRETQHQIHRQGKIDVQRLHFFYQAEQSEALDILEEYIRVELCRILVLGGGNAFLSRKALKSFRHTLQDRMRYLQTEILPVTGTHQFRELGVPRYWAVQHQEEMKAGPFGVLPGFASVAPVKTDHRFCPGEHRELPCRGGTVMQGIGYLTNVLPKDVEAAQQKGALHTKVTPAQLVCYLQYLRDPDQVLGHLFSGAFYAVEAAEYYSAASYVEASLAVVRRKRFGQCVFCGKPADGADICAQCSRRIKIV